MKKITLLTTLLLCAIGSGPARADIISINLNDFFADPTVTITADGTSATIVEDPAFFSVLLSNDPGLGDPDVITAGVDTTLLFDFDFSEGLGNDDEFFAAVLDSSGFSAGAAFELLFSDSASGTVGIDLSSLVGEAFLGLQFELVSFDDVFDSVLTISNVRLDTPMADVPEPGTATLMLIGLTILLGVMHRRRRFVPLRHTRRTDTSR